MREHPPVGRAVARLEARDEAVTMSHTVGDSVSLFGVGLHGGQPARIEIRPARPGTGFVFHRIDMPGARGIVPALADRVVDTRLCTRIANAHGASVGTIEHVMAALAGCGVSDAVLRIDGPEVPIMDGSAQPFVDAIQAVGLRRLSRPRRAIGLRRSVMVRDGDRMAALHPAPRFGARFRIAFEDAAIGEQALSLVLAGDGVVSGLADCRTFVRRREIEALHAAGLALGGSLDNAVVVDGPRVLNPSGLRRPDEFVRHKMLDAVGDLALAGAPIIGQYEGDRSGHEMTNRLLRALLADRDAWDWVEPAAGQLPCLGRTDLPAEEEARLAV